MTKTEQQRTGFPASGAVVIGIAMVLLGLAEGYGQLAPDPETNCFDRTPPLGVSTTTEDVNKSWSAGFWPLGLTCIWSGEADSDIVQPSNDWIATAGVYGGGVSIGGALIPPHIKRRRKRRYD